MGNTGESYAAYMENRKERPKDAAEGSKGTDCKWYISKDGDDGCMQIRVWAFGKVIT